MAGKRRKNRAKAWRPPLRPFNLLDLCHCGVEKGMKRMRGQTELCCLVCACNWIKGQDLRVPVVSKEVVIEARPEMKPRLRDRMRDDW